MSSFVPSLPVLRSPATRRLCLAVAMLLALLVLQARPASAAPGGWLGRINQLRASHGLAPLVEDVQASGVAQTWTLRMAATNTLAHNPSLASLVTAPWSKLGENVGYGGSESSVFDAFVASAPHRANLLDPGYTRTGIGQTLVNGRLWTTHVFLRVASDPVLPVGTSPTGVAGAAGRSTDGLWTTTPMGRVTAKGAAPSYGQITFPLNQPIVGMAATPSGRGYWLVARDGGIFPFGDAGGYGSTGGIRLNQPIVGMASTRTGRGYWLVAADGGIFPFGDAGGYGSTGNIRLNQPMVGMAPSPTGAGYLLVASDGGVFPFGDAGGYGSTGGIRLNQPIVGMASSKTGRGYWLIAADGGIFPFGDAPGYGSLGGRTSGPAVAALVPTSTGAGYWLPLVDGAVAAFGDARAV